MAVKQFKEIKLLSLDRKTYPTYILKIYRYTYHIHRERKTGKLKILEAHVILGKKLTCVFSSLYTDFLNMEYNLIY